MKTYYYKTRFAYALDDMDLCGTFGKYKSAYALRKLLTARYKDSMSADYVRLPSENIMLLSWRLLDIKGYAVRDGRLENYTLISPTFDAFDPDFPDRDWIVTHTNAIREYESVQKKIDRFKAKNVPLFGEFCKGHNNINVILGCTKCLAPFNIRPDESKSRRPGTVEHALKLRQRRDSYAKRKTDTCGRKARTMSYDVWKDL